MQKGEAVKQAYAQIRISGLTVDPTPEDIELAIWELDQMMWEWQGKRRLVNYNFPPPTTGDELVVSDPADPFDVYDWAVSGSVMSLACRLVEYFGKPIPDSLARKTRAAVNVIKQNSIKFTHIPYPNRMPRGSGNTYRVPEQMRFYRPEYTGRAKQEGVNLTQEFTDTIDFTKQLGSSERIFSYVIRTNADGGVKLLDDSIDGNVVYYRGEVDNTRDTYVEVEAKTLTDLIIILRKNYTVVPVTSVPVN